MIDILAVVVAIVLVIFIDDLVWLRPKRRAFRAPEVKGNPPTKREKPLFSHTQQVTINKPEEKL